MSLDLQEGQRASIVRMFQLKSNSEEVDRRLETVPQWKVLIYDRACQDVIAPILKVWITIMHSEISFYRLGN